MNIVGYKQFSKWENKISKLRKNGDLQGCIDECANMLRNIRLYKNNYQLIEWKHMMWRCYYMIGKCKKYLPNHITASISQLETSLNYAFTDTEYIKSKWLMANCYVSVKNYNMALILYKQCEQHCKTLEEVDDYIRLTRGLIIETECEITHSVKRIIQALDILISFDDDSYEINGYDRKEVLEKTYLVLFDSYIKQFNLMKKNSILQEAWNTLHNINTIETKKILLEKFNLAINQKSA